MQPLLYQVATAGLAAPAIAAPIRSLFRQQSNLTTLLSVVVLMDWAMAYSSFSRNARVVAGTLYKKEHVVES